MGGGMQELELVTGSDTNMPVNTVALLCVAVTFVRRRRD